VAKRYAGRGVLIEHDVGDAGGRAVRGDADDGDRDVEGELRVDEEEAVDAAAHEELLILVFEIGLAEMADGEVEEAFLEKMLFDAEHDSGEVALAEFGSDDADGVGEAGALHAGVQVGAVGEFFGGGVNALLGDGGDGGCDGGVVEDDGDGGGREIQILGEHFEGGRFVGVGEVLFCGHRAPMDVQQFYTLGRTGAQL
jgi:hypothetical protein